MPKTPGGLSRGWSDPAITGSHASPGRRRAPRGLVLPQFVGEGDDLSNLFLPHTFFGRSEINNAVFRNTDFTGSNLCWNDFVDVDFTDAVLAGSDMRASLFQRVQFVRTDLRRADLRRSTFEGCTFEGALMAGAILTQNQMATMGLSKGQIDEVAWSNDEGDEPDGG